MDLESGLVNTITENKDVKLIILSYRNYKRLTPQVQEIFNKYKDNYTPKERGIALATMYIILKSLEKAKFGLWDRISPEEFVKISLESAKEQQHKLSIPRGTDLRVTDNQLEKEFKFQGFVPSSKFNAHNGYAYICSNRPVKGEFYIYPKKFTSNFPMMQKRPSYPYLYKYFARIGVIGHTCLVIPGEYVIENHHLVEIHKTK